MITFGEIFFCERVILNPDGSPLSDVTGGPGAQRGWSSFPMIIVPE
jgi:hypothetical protein